MKAKSKRSQLARENRSTVASQRHAILVVKPEHALHGALSKRDRNTCGTRKPPVSPSPAVVQLKPNAKVRGTHSAGQALLDGRATNASRADSHVSVDTQRGNAVGRSKRNSHLYDVNRVPVAVAGGGRSKIEDQTLDAAPTTRKTFLDNHDPVISQIIELWKNRQAWHRAEKSLTLQGKAQCRRGTAGDKTEANKLFAAIEKIAEGKSPLGCDAQATAALAPAILPFIEARTPLEKHRNDVEKQLEKLAKSLPAWQWAKDIKGFGAGSLAAIVGSAGDLNNYDTVSRLWKRMGVAVINGERQRKKSDSIAALEHGYAPHRASVMFNIGGGLIGGMSHGPRLRVGEDVSKRKDLSPYQKRYVEIVHDELEKVTDTWNGPEHRREPVEKDGELRESYSSYVHNRARRRVGKEFLCDLRAAWKRLTMIQLESKNPMSGATIDHPAISPVNPSVNLPDDEASSPIGALKPKRAMVRKPLQEAAE